MSREMKDSGIDWLGNMPKDWSAPKVKYHALFFNGDRGKNYPGDDDFTSEGVPFITSNNLHGTILDTDSTISKYITDECYNRMGGAKIQLDDILFCLRGSVGICAINKELTKGTVASSLMDVRPVKVNPDFLNYYFHSELTGAQTTTYMNGSCAANLSAEAVANYFLLLPTDDEQRAIVSFLDRKCSAIDTAIAKTKESIEKLEEYKKTVITKAVTKGLDPDAKMKDSGIEWIGEVPENWEVEPIKYLFRILKRIAGKEGYDVISITQKGLRIRDVSNNEGQVAESYAKYQFVYPGDFAMNHMDLLTGGVGLSDLFGVTSPDYRVFRRISEKSNNKYYEYVFRSCYWNKIFYGMAMGIAEVGRKRLQAPVFLNIKFPAPPTDEQARIAKYLDRKCSAIDALIAKKQTAIEKWEEYKKSLIYYAVTGKIDCRTETTEGIG